MDASIEAGRTGVLVATAQVQARPGAAAALPGQEDGTPEQISLTWGSDPATTMVVSWASPAQAIGPRVLLTKGDGWTRTALAEQRTYTDDGNGDTAWAYYAEFKWLAPDTSYSYTVTADNDRSAKPFSSRFRTAPVGRAPFRFTSFGEGTRAGPGPAVESFQPLFHLPNGEFGGNYQASAANRAWMPCAGNREFRVGSAMFFSLGADDAEETAWLERTLATARADRTIDWILVQARRIRPEWRPLFDSYQVDLVLSGHDRDYERSLTGYGIAVFDVDPGRKPGGPTSIAVRSFKALGADPEFESFTLTRRRSDGCEH
jgi:hypothetical protein